MDRDTWIVLECAARIVARRLPKPRRRWVFSDRQIILMWLWAAWHDRPMCWVCRRENCRGLFRPRRLPSVSQFCKRLTSPRFALIRRRLQQVLARRGQADMLNFIDGKPLMVHPYSGDRDARTGVAAGGFARGYRLHARVGHSGFLLEYTVLPLNESETGTARSLLNDLWPDTLILADAAYDSAPLYAAVTARRGRLLTRLKGQHLRQLGSRKPVRPARRQALQAWATAPALCEQAMHMRDGVERVFARLGNFGGGLGPLPAWVRRLPRVQRWVDAKIAIYHARLIATSCRLAA